MRQVQEVWEEKNMQITETVSEGLRREYKVVVPASELDCRLLG